MVLIFWGLLFLANLFSHEQPYLITILVCRQIYVSTKYTEEYELMLFDRFVWRAKFYLVNMKTII
jgi:hypothetical protein